jgi:hypothetical protein
MARSTSAGRERPFPPCPPGRAGLRTGSSVPDPAATARIGPAVQRVPAKVARRLAAPRPRSRVMQVEAARVRPLRRKRSAGGCDVGMRLPSALGLERIARDRRGRDVMRRAPGSRRSCSRRFPEAAARDRPAGPGAAPPGHRCGRRCRGPARTISCSASPMPCRRWNSNPSRRLPSPSPGSRRHGVGVVGGELRVEPVGASRACARRRGRRHPSRPCG